MTQEEQAEVGELLSRLATLLLKEEVVAFGGWSFETTHERSSVVRIGIDFSIAPKMERQI